ncbi:MAG: 4-(cytidine 5'-diphospho)-2-C-methyl-D-erythritol kinase [Robiginitomaculum sp.]|nr:MAG: 4-(cytidine 5'-diphospho)-2-C-methyl-D-erythritol kinase [Robiginitomaculum sp.]
MTSAKIFSAKARAKINLTLHVGQMGGFENLNPPRPHSPDKEALAKMHPLNSLVVFADIGDDLLARAAGTFSLNIEGAFADRLGDNDKNLVMKAVNKTSAVTDIYTKLSYVLSKKLPVSSGIGGGSADAAAALRLLGYMNNDIEPDIESILVEVGADVPVCYLSKTCIMEGVGETLTECPGLGQLFAVLINPDIAVSTKDVFDIFDAQYDTQKTTAFSQSNGDGSLLEMATFGRNDLQAAAIQIAPIIQTVLDELQAQTDCQLARMSGSGATCFGIFKTQNAADHAAKTLQDMHPDWWCVATLLGDENEL